MKENDAPPTNSHDMDAPPPPLGGGDIELGNFIEGRPFAMNTGAEAAQAILAEIEGYPTTVPVVPSVPPSGAGAAGHAAARFDGGGHAGAGVDGGGHAAVIAGGSSGGAWNPRDWCRKFLKSNGACIYIDLGHTEVCLPEVTSARAFVAYWHAMLQIVRLAQVQADLRLPPGQRLQVLVNNSDGRDNSYGAHLNFLVTRGTFEALFRHKLHLALFLATYQVSSIVFTGQGKVGSENGRPPVSYQLSQRADFFETLVGLQTTYHRPLINARDEALCGRRYYAACSTLPAQQFARLHVIFYDANLCHVACYLKFGVLQIILAMIGAGHVDPNLILEDPVEAVVAWSHDVSLTRRMSMLSGDQLTAVELQLRFLEEARRFVDGGHCNVPDAPHILALWEDTLLKLRAGSLDALAPRLDWVLKLTTLRQVLEQEPELMGDTRKLKYLDHLYGSLDPEEGLYWSYDRDGAVERIADDAAIERAMTRPPEDTRAWTRAQLLRMADPASVRAVDWDSIRFTFDAKNSWLRHRTIEMGDPCGLTRSDAGPAFTDTGDLAETLDLLGVP
jgi:proteasome accessory factor A